MFGRLTNVRIKAAEDALDQGRLDEAFDVLGGPEAATHARVQALRGRLVEAYLRQGQDLMLDQKFGDARSAFDRALRLNNEDVRVQDWLRRAVDALADRQTDAAKHQGALRNARRYLEAGRLDHAAEALEAARADDDETRALASEIERRMREAGALVASAEKAQQAGRLESAVADLARARSLHQSDPQIDALLARLTADITNAAHTELCAGRIQAAAAVLRHLDVLGSDASSQLDVHEALTLCERVAAALRQSEYREADVLLGRLARRMPTAQWVAEARQRLHTIDENRRALMEGPLGPAVSLAGAGNTAPTKSPGSAPNQPPPPPPVGARHAARSQLPMRLLLRIDGVGSFLLLRGERIVIGRAGPNAMADVPLVSDLSERQAEIVRTGEDYFIVSHGGVELAGQSKDHALLQSGDRIRLSRGARLTFQKPSLKSATAMLDLNEGVRMPSDCRRVILCGGPVLLGATRECHIRLPASCGEYVLMERGGQLFVKSMRHAASGRTLGLGEPVTLGELSFRVLDWDAATGLRADAGPGGA